MNLLRFPFVLSLLFSFLNVDTFAQISTADSIKYSNQILRIEQQLLDAIPSGDTIVWGKYLDRNYFISTEDGTTYNKKEFLTTFGPLPKGYSGYIHIINPHLIFREKTAILHYVSDEYEWVLGQKIHTAYSTMNVYYPVDTSWKILGGQVFEIPQLPPATDVSKEILNTYAGTYSLADTITCKIIMENEKLYIQKKNRNKEELFPETNNIFFRKSDTRGRKIFVKNQEGRMLMLERRNGQDVVWKRNF